MENNGIDEREAEKDETNEQVHGKEIKQRGLSPDGMAFWLVNDEIMQDRTVEFALGCFKSGFPFQSGMK